jgi:hypothetical protein
MLKRTIYKQESEKEAAERAGQLWSSSAEFDEAWKRRIETMASYIEGAGTVADFGCGMMWLKPLLPPGNSYLGIDYLPRTSETIVLNLNTDALDGIVADIAFLSGVMEYVEDVPSFIGKLKERNFRQVILSYCTIEKHPEMAARHNCNWASHASIFDILAWFLPEFRLTALDEVNNHNTIMAFSRHCS